jgi:hypothetical protein
MGISLCIIAKDEVEAVKKIIASYKDFFDHIVIAGDMRHDEFGALTGVYQGKGRDCTVHYHQYKWIKDFADKRNFIADKVKTEYYFRLDTDDEIGNPEAIKPVLDRIIANKIDVLYVPYHYSKDADGNLNGFHWRETIIKKDANCLEQV